MDRMFEYDHSWPDHRPLSLLIPYWPESRRTKDITIVVPPSTTSLFFTTAHFIHTFNLYLSFLHTLTTSLQQSS